MNECRTWVDDPQMYIVWRAQHIRFLPLSFRSFTFLSVLFILFFIFFLIFFCGTMCNSIVYYTRNTIRVAVCRVCYLHYASFIRTFAGSLLRSFFTVFFFFRIHFFLYFLCHVPVPVFARGWRRISFGCSNVYMVAVCVCECAQLCKMIGTNRV